ncbi:GNAT family N-acetyltransferase [Aurantiacibacter sp. D1-12]|uniref:GNAT family N-acetyltransferase n=1 Tax=Aurantiacibacter sp. D1-12 TaxID=2993658 RepID=UPI00237CC099|nr:GNAT family N-acetyltransferase [Aurantiacibacter sp. D1-12]MDE1466574.1 GNAT family N-acetyltransferase [Aurantiacibacter sp. D1-12]
MTAVSYHDTVNDLQGLNWSGGGPFARLEWFALLETTAASPLIVLAQDGDQALTMPLQFGDGQLEPLTNWYAFSWRALSTEERIPHEMITAIGKALAKRTNRIVLDKVPEEEVTARALSQGFFAAGWHVIREQSDVNHVLSLNGRTYEEYLSGRPGPLRTTLKRKAKKVEVVLATTFSEEDWAAYEAVYADSWKPEEGDPALLRNFAELESAAGRYRFALAKLEGKPVAAQFWTVENGTAYIHKLAHRQSAQNVSPGTTLTAALMQHVIDLDHVKMVDFGTGDDPYKRDWMEDIRTRYRLTCVRPGDPRNWLIMGKALIRKLVRR